LSNWDFIDYLDGITYAVDTNYKIVALSEKNWEDFARANEGIELSDPNTVVGRSLFEFVSGGEIRQAYQDLMNEIIQGQRDGWSCGYRCDAPDRKREMRMAVTAVRTNQELDGFLFQSILLDERSRPPLDIFNFRKLSSAINREVSSPLVMYHPSVEFPALAVSCLGPGAGGYGCIV